MLHYSYIDALAQLPAPRVRYVVSLSSGVSSAIAADRAIQRWGADAVDLVFMDTLWEDDDNYRFLADLEAHWQHPITRLTDGRTPLEVAEQEHIIPNQKIAPCTHRLKIELFMSHIEALKSKYDLVVIVLGMNWTEKHRLASPRRNYAQRGFWVEYPLLWPPMELYPFDTVRGWGIEPPRMYAQGYSHANCGGRCVKQGKGDWLRTLAHYPERFEEAAVWERTMRQDERFSDYGFLRDQRGGELRAMSLDELRAQHEADRGGQIPLFVLPAAGELQDDQTNCFCNAADPGPVCKTA
jgi:3'-phosphoadenosine 5'-phosphosulfate sulfotransferase (PAPS reductase)/FAD synthetase